MPNPETPPTVYDKLVVYDFVTDNTLVPKVIGYREAKGFTILSVAEQPEALARYTTGLADNGFPVGPALAIPPQTKVWVIASKASV